MVEVLRSIVDAPADHLQANLQAIIDNAVRLCRTDKGFLYLREGDVFKHVVDVGASPDVVEFNKSHPISPGRDTSTGRAALERGPVHIPDIHEDPEYEYWEAQRLGGFQTLLSVPMLHRDEVIGVLSVWRSEVEPFTDDEIELLSAFAEQAVLALVTSQLIETIEHQKVELSRYLPPQVAELLSSSEGRRLLEGHRSEIVSFSSTCVVLRSSRRSPNLRKSYRCSANITKRWVATSSSTVEPLAGSKEMGS